MRLGGRGFDSRIVTGPRRAASPILALAWALLAGCAASAAATEAGPAPARDAQCLASADDVVVPDAVDDAGCPERVEVTHAWSAPAACDRVVPRCAIAPACRFTTRLVAPQLAGCTEPAMEGAYRFCRCEFGVIECPGDDPVLGLWPGCVGNRPWCHRCEAAARDR